MPRAEFSKKTMGHFAEAKSALKKLDILLGMPSQVGALHCVCLGIGNACWGRVVEPAKAFQASDLM